MTRKQAGPYIKIAIAMSLVFALLWPWSEQVIPPWSVRLSTRSGRPAVGIPVQEVWSHQSVEPRSNVEMRKTDAAGEVHFPERSIRLNSARLVFGISSKVLRYWHNASFGPHGQISIGIEELPANCEAFIYSPAQAHASELKSECVVPEAFKASVFQVAPLLQGGPSPAAR